MAAALVHPKGLRGDVSVHDALGVNVGHTLQYLLYDADDHLCFNSLGVRDNLKQISALEHLSNYEVLELLVIRAMDLHDGRMGKVLIHLAFRLNPLLLFL